jgi:hypothetical protein
MGFREVRLVKKPPLRQPICFVDFTTPHQAFLAMGSLQGECDIILIYNFCLSYIGNIFRLTIFLHCTLEVIVFLLLRIVDTRFLTRCVWRERERERLWHIHYTLRRMLGFGMANGFITHVSESTR